jgi:3-oxoacyl-[acyl-carrier protein] reductase
MTFIALQAAPTLPDSSARAITTTKRERSGSDAGRGDMGRYITLAMASEQGRLDQLQHDQGAAALAGKRALVVGGSGGIGKAVASALAARGASLVITGGSEGRRLTSSLSEFRARGFSVEGLSLSIGAPHDLMDRLLGLGHFDILVPAFGPFLQKPLDSTSETDWERIVLLNLALPGALASYYLPGMMERSWGRILFFGGTSTDAVKPSRSNAAYASAKTGLGVLAKSIAAEYAEQGIAAFVVCPGLVETEYLDEAARAYGKEHGPRGRLISTGELAESAIALLAAEPCLASGAVISLDAGLSF